MQNCHEGVKKKTKQNTQANNKKMKTKTKKNTKPKKNPLFTKCYVLQCLMFTWTGNRRINSD